MTEYDRPYHCPWVAKHKPSGAIIDLSDSKSHAKKRFDEFNFSDEWELAFEHGNMHDSKWHNETPCDSLPSEFFNQ